jgi:hypothetical protein
VQQIDRFGHEARWIGPEGSNTSAPMVTCGLSACPIALLIGSKGTNRREPVNRQANQVSGRFEISKTSWFHS